MGKAAPHLFSVSCLTFVCEKLGITTELIRLHFPELTLSPYGTWIDVAASVALAYGILTTVLHIGPATARAAIGILTGYIRCHDFTVGVAAEAWGRIERGFLDRTASGLQHLAELIKKDPEESERNQ